MPAAERTRPDELRRLMPRALQDVPFLAALIGYAGIVPMLAGLAVVVAGGFAGVTRAAALVALIHYAAIALTFLAGIRWGMALRLGGTREEIAFLLAAPLPALFAWIATFLPGTLALGLLAASFAGQGAWDVWTADRGRVPAWYGALRLRHTLAAVLILVLTLLALLR